MPVASKKDDIVTRSTLQGLSVTELARRIDHISTQQEAYLQQADEDALATVRVASAEADRAQKSCDELRARVRQRRMDLDREQSKTQQQSREIVDLERRTEALQAELAAVRQRQAHEPASHPLPLSATASSPSSSKHSNIASASRGEETDLDYAFLTQRLHAEVEAEEISVQNLRRKHMDLVASIKRLSKETEQAELEAKSLQTRRDALEKQRLIAAAAAVNPAHREATSLQRRLDELVQLNAVLEDDLQQSRMETHALLAHLMSGAQQRSSTLNSLRKRLVMSVGASEQQQQQQQSSRMHSAHEQSLSDSHFASSLLEENERRRAEFVQIVVAGEQERDALREYADVLSQRLEKETEKLRGGSRRRMSAAQAIMMNPLGNFSSSPRPL